MEGFFLLLGLLALATCILPWVNLFRHNALESDVTDLRRQLNDLLYQNSCAVDGNETPI